MVLMNKKSIIIYIKNYYPYLYNMDNNKVYFTIGLNSSAYVAGVGYRYNINLNTLIKQQYNKYRAFNIKLESTSYQFSTASSVISCIHLRGLTWINGYDSISPNYMDTKVIEIIATNLLTNTISSTTYPSNCNAIGFYKPSVPNVTLIFFVIDMDGNFYEMPNTSTSEIQLVLSITGIDAYKIQQPSKGLRYEYQRKDSSTFTLNFYNGVSIDLIDSTATKGRVRRFKNINFRNIIGNEMYDKYDKFALVTRKTFNFIYPTGGNYSSGSWYFTFFLSANNLNFETVSYTNQTIVSGTNSLSYHYKNPVLIGLGGLLFNDYYIENIFTKPAGDITDIVISYCQAGYLNLPTANTSNTELYPNIIFNFEIIPVIEN